MRLHRLHERNDRIEKDPELLCVDSRGG